MRKEGALYDLPMLISLLIATRQLENTFDDAAFIGELSLSGEVRAVSGVLPMVIMARNAGITRVFLPADNIAEASVVRDMEFYPVPDVTTLLAYFRGANIIEPITSEIIIYDNEPKYPIFGCKRTAAAKRAWRVAAAGGA